MGTLKIGRLGYDLDIDPNNITLRGSDTSEGTQVTFQGDIVLTTDQARSMKDDFSRLTEESFIAITFSTDAYYDGFYIVTSASVTDSYEVGKYEWVLQTKRLGSDNRIALESVLTTVERTNDFAGVTPVTWFGLPPDYGYADLGTAAPSVVPRTFAEGVTKVFYHATALAGVDPVWSVDAGSYYESAAAVEYKDGNGDYRKLIGKDLPAGKEHSWRLTNGGIRYVPDADGTTSQFTIEYYDGTTWVTGEDFEFNLDSSDLDNSWDQVTVIKNTPEVCIVRLVGGLTNSGAYTLDLTLRRGSRFIEGLFTVTSSSRIELKHVVANGGSIFDGGIQDNVDDGNGDRYVLLCPISHNTDANGGIYILAITEFPFAVGYAVGGSGAASGDGSTDMRDQYFDHTAETTFPVLR